VKAALLRHEGAVPVHDLCAARTMRQRLAARERTRLDARHAGELVALPRAVGE
jgi:hypothetical protein